MKKVLVGIFIVGTLALPAALPAGAASSNLSSVHVPPPPDPTPHLGPVFNPGGPMHTGPSKVHCDCLRLVNGHTESCCP